MDNATGVIVVASLLLLGRCCEAAAAPTPGSSQQKPLVCAAMLSYNRPHYLIPSVRALVTYMTAVEPGIPWTLQILDNGSGPTALANITEELAPLKQTGLVRLVHLNKNIGLSRGFNVLFFDMCASTGAPYLLSLEDDWKARSDWPANFPILHAAMLLLEKHDKLLEVWLRDSRVGFPLHKNTSWQHDTFDVPDYYSPGLSNSLRFSAQVRINECNPASHPWGGYSNGASLKHFGRLQTMGRMPYVDGEADYSARACFKGYQTAYICRDTSCYEPVKQWHTGLFEHIGLRRVDASTDARSASAGGASVPQDPENNVTLQDFATHEMLAASSHRESKRIYRRAVWQQQWAQWDMTKWALCFGGVSIILALLGFYQRIRRVRTLRVRRARHLSFMHKHAES